MNRTFAHLTCWLVIAAGGGIAWADTQFASGLEHDSVGGVSSLSVTDRKLTACCLGSSGEDGVEVRFDSAWGGVVGIEVDQLLLTTGTLHTTWKGWDGTVKGRCEITSNGDGTAVTTFDFSDLGATAVRTVLYGAGGVVDDDTTTGGPIVAYPVVPNCPDGTAPVWWQIKRWDPNTQKYVYMQVWSCAEGFNIHGDPYPSMRVITPIFPVGVQDDDGVDALVVTGDEPNELVLVEAELHTWDVSSWGVGQAHVNEECSVPSPCDRSAKRLVVTNLGSSGDDGVSLFRQGDIPLGAEVQVSTVQPGGTGSETFRWRKGHELTGHVTLMKSNVAPNPATGDIDVTIDFSDIGSTDYTITLYDDLGVPITAALFPSGIPFTISPCPMGTVWVNKWPPKYSGCEIVVDPTGAYFGPITGVSSMTFEPVDPLIPLETPDSCVITSDDAGGTIIVDDVVVTPCLGDVSGDGVIDLTDLGTLLGNYGLSPATFAQGDLNGDHVVDLTDLGLLLGNYGAACP